MTIAVAALMGITLGAPGVAVDPLPMTPNPQPEPVIQFVDSSFAPIQLPEGLAQGIICEVFGPYCSEALAVAECESDFNPAAVNGQYLGVFQMGDYERATYGHGATVEEQAQAAYRYFVAAGSDWSPWECKP